jgi:hypothetical protein
MTPAGRQHLRERVEGLRPRVRRAPDPRQGEFDFAAAGTHQSPLDSGIDFGRGFMRQRGP